MDAPCGARPWCTPDADLARYGVDRRAKVVTPSDRSAPTPTTCRDTLLAALVDDREHDRENSAAALAVGTADRAIPRAREVTWWLTRRRAAPNFR